MSKTKCTCIHSCLMWVIIRYVNWQLPKIFLTDQICLIYLLSISLAADETSSNPLGILGKILLLEFGIDFPVGGTTILVNTHQTNPAIQVFWKTGTRGRTVHISTTLFFTTGLKEATLQAKEAGCILGFHAHFMDGFTTLVTYFCHLILGPPDIMLCWMVGTVFCVKFHCTFLLSFNLNLG